MNELSLTLGRIAEAVDGELRGGSPETEVKDVVTDSRTIGVGDLFVALRGPRFDAHEFVADVLNHGAAAAIVERRWADGSEERADLKVRPNATTIESDRHRVEGRIRQVGADLEVRPRVIVVDDTLQALQDLAHYVRKAVTTQVIAITGSAGKTTTKETIAVFLGGRFRVVKNKGNLNNHIGLPLSLMQLRTQPDVAVMELGMNHAGEIRTLVAIAEPEVRVWTNVGDAHLGFFESADAIADAKAEILEGSGRETVLVCNADDPRIVGRVSKFPGQLITFGTDEHATVRAVDVNDLGLRGMRARVTTPAGEASIETPLLGRGNLLNVLAGTAVALHFGVSLAEVASAASRLIPADRRGAVRSLRGITVIDDSYNSSPSALRRALEVMAADTGARRKVAVLGEMLELGDHATRLHRDCGRAAAEAGLAVLFAIGGAPARELADAAIEAGLPTDAVHYFAKSDAAAPAVVNAVREGDLVLVKGSRGIRTDVVADRLGAEFA